MLTPDDISAAAQRIKPFAVRTPLVENAVLNDVTGARVFVKAEPLQRTGSFKFRGACNQLLQLSPDEAHAGVLAWSSGNHALAVSTAAKLLGIDATIVMPEDAPAPKVEGTRAQGAEILFYNRHSDNREEIGRARAAETGAKIIHPYDDERTMAGQGTIGKEIAENMARQDITPDVVLVPVSGGGLIAGVSTWIKSVYPDCEVFAVEPENFDDHARSLHDDRRRSADPSQSSICDALLAVTPGERTFEINRKLLSGGLRVSDEQALKAVSWAAKNLKLVVEPGGAVALASALFTTELDLAGKNVVIVASGGNINPELLAAVL